VDANLPLQITAKIATLLHMTDGLQLTN